MSLLRHVSFLPQTRLVFAATALIALSLLPTRAAGQGRRDDSRSDSGGASNRGFFGGGGSRNRWMDRDGDGQIEPDEVPDFMRERFQSSLRDAGIDPRRPVSVERYDELSRQRFERSGLGSFGGQGGRDERDRDRRRYDRLRYDNDRSGSATDQST